jgi:hypothetical protein
MDNDRMSLLATMISSWKRTLSVKRGFFTNGTYTTDPVLIYNLVVVAADLFLCLF